jgi:hypothetical protein
MMKASIQDPQALQALSPLDIAAYLRTRGWQEVQADPRASRWILRRKKEEFEVLLPLDRQLRDYSLRISELLASLAAVEQRSQLQILTDLTTTGVDIVRFRAVHPYFESGSVPLRSGLALVQGGRDILLAAACSTVAPSGAFVEPFPEALRYVETLRLGQTERGGFVVVILSPVLPELQASPVQGLEDPFERRVLKTLMKALIAIRGAASESMTSGTIDPFEHSIDSGVSANLCETLASLQEEIGAALEIEITWATTRDMRDGDVARQAHFSPDAGPILREAARVMRERHRIRGCADYDSGLVKAVEEAKQAEEDLRKAQAG